jgi:hypothetical protein
MALRNKSRRDIGTEEMAMRSKKNRGEDVEKEKE